MIAGLGALAWARAPSRTRRSLLVSFRMNNLQRPARSEFQGGGVIPHSSHWGAYSVVRSEAGSKIVPHPNDQSPSPLLGNLLSSRARLVRISQPMVRAGWLEGGAGPTDRR